MNISGREIGPEQSPYIIAELSSNHLGDLDRACRLIEIASEAGADAVKIQTFDADSLTIESNRPEFIVRTPPWEGLSYYELYKKIALPHEFTGKLFRVAKDLGITLFSSPFDEGAVRMLETLDCPAYKVASFEACDDQLLEACARTGKPVIVSSGVAGVADLEVTLDVLSNAGCQEVALLHCVSAYPAKSSDMNVRALNALGELGVTIGLSDHSLSNLAATLAIACGAAIIEKHFTISRADGGPDAGFSLEPNELKQLIVDVRDAWEAMGSANVLTDEKRRGSEHARSIFLVKNIEAGMTITSDHVRVIRPGLGLPPRSLGKVIGRRAGKTMERGHPMSWDDIV